MTFINGVSIRKLHIQITLFSYTRKLFYSKGPIQQKTWNDFFEQRRRLKLLGAKVGIPSALLFILGEGYILSQPIFDPTMTVYGVDPTIVLVLGTISGIFGAYFIGSTAARMIWRLRNPELFKWMNERQKDYYSRIVKYRANIPPIPTNPTLNTDFHGEKVNSVADYCAWLRKQRLYRNRTIHV